MFCPRNMDLLFIAKRILCCTTEKMNRTSDSRSWVVQRPPFSFDGITWWHNGWPLYGIFGPGTISAGAHGNTLNMTFQKEKKCPQHPWTLPCGGSRHDDTLMIDPGSEKTSEREASPWASTGTAAAATRPIRESPNAKTHYPLQDFAVRRATRTLTEANL
jgi:hypothetical protein